MTALPIISFAMLAVLLMNMLAKSRPIAKTVIPGKILRVVPLSILSKVWVHRFGLIALTTGLIFCYFTGWLPFNLVIMVAAFALVIVLLPMKLTLTTKGLSMGDAVYRSWNDFSGLKINKTYLRLENPSIFMRTVLFVRSNDQHQIVELIENHIPALLPNG